MEDEVSLAMSFMNMRKSIGPSTVPWGTPDRTEASLDAWPSTTTLWDRQDRNDSIQLMTLLSRLKSLGLGRRLWCGTLWPSQNQVLLRLLGSICWEWQPGRGMLWSVAYRTSDVFGIHAECPLGGGAGQSGAWSARLWCARWVYSRSMSKMSKIRDGSSPVWLCPPSWRLEWPMLSASELCQCLVTARWWRSAYRSTRHCMSSGILLGSLLGRRLSSDSVGWGAWRRHYWRPW